MKSIMSMHSLASYTLVATLAMMSAPLFADQSRIETYDAEDGQSYFALTVPPIAASDDRPRDVVVLLDTSASQAGFYRDTAVAALERCVESLAATDRVQIMAVDLDARAMSDAMLSPGDAAIKTAVEKIRREPPLGSTDMELAVSSAAKLLESSKDRDRQIIYIGDGISSANLLETESFGRLASKLRSEQVAVHSFAVGPKRDLPLLAALANQTGGNLFIDPEMTWPDEAEGITTKRAMEEKPPPGRRCGQSASPMGAWHCAASHPNQLARRRGRGLP